MDVRIGIIHSARELDIDLPEGQSTTTSSRTWKRLLHSLTACSGWSTNEGATWRCSSAKIAYIEIGGGSEDRRVGFGTS